LTQAGNFACFLIRAVSQTQDDHQMRPETAQAMSDHFKSNNLNIRNGVRIFTSRGEKITLAQVQDILDDEGI
jgi:hypothetical protein